MLETLAPIEAIILVRGKEVTFENSAGDTMFEEGEVVVDPFKLGRVTIVERLRAHGFQAS